MKDYKEFTFGRLIFALLIPIHLIMTYLYINNIGSKPMATNGYIVVTITFMLIYFLFYGLTTRINSDFITISFGVGLIKKKIELSRIKAVVAIKTPWYYGWGIRIVPNGILYSIRGADGVELIFNDTNRIIRIGTQDSITLKREIEKRLV